MKKIVTLLWALTVFLVVSALAYADSSVGLIVVDKNNLGSVEREFHNLMEAGGTVDFIDANDIKCEYIDLSHYSTLACFTYGGSDRVALFDQDIVDAIMNRVSDGATFIANGEAGGAKFFNLAGYMNAGNHSGWYPALRDSVCITKITEGEPLFENVEIYSGDPQSQSVSYWDSGDHEFLIFRVDNRRSYTGRYACKGSCDSLIEPDRYLAAGFGTGWSVGSINEKWWPEWRRGSGRLILASGLNWTFNQSSQIGGYIGIAGRQLLKNIGSGFAVTDIDPLINDLTFVIKDQDGNPLDGYLVFRKPPPTYQFGEGVFDDTVVTDYYQYFRSFGYETNLITDYNSDILPYDIDGNKDTNDDRYVGVYVKNGIASINRNQIIDNRGFSTDLQLDFDKLTYVFFFPTQQSDPYYENETINTSNQLMLCEMEFAGSVTWWTLNLCEEDYTDSGNKFIQIATIMDDEFWTDQRNYLFNKAANDLSETGTGYFPSHSEKQSFILEPPISNGRIQTSDDIDEENKKTPLLLVHGINGSANYWGESDGLSYPNSLKNNGVLAWEFYYRGQDDLFDSAEMLSKAVDIIHSYNSEYKINLVSHSYGGVVTRNLLHYNLDNSKSKINSILMIGPPHHGSWSAYRVLNNHMGPIMQRLSCIPLDDSPYLDPNAPVYKELTPGSASLMKMDSANTNVFEDISTLILAGTDGLFLGGFGHDEAPMYDDGVVSVSSASLLNNGINLGLIDLDHVDQIKDEDVVAFIENYFYGSWDSNTDAGPNKFVYHFIKSSLENDGTYNISSDFDYPWFFNRSGIIITANDTVEKIEIVDKFDQLLCGNYFQQLTKTSDNIFTFYDDSTEFFCHYDAATHHYNPGLAFPFETTLYDSEINYINSPKIIHFKIYYNDDPNFKMMQGYIKPCITNILKLDDLLPAPDSDHDGYADYFDSFPYNADIDNDGLIDGNTGCEDLNVNGIVDFGETDPQNPDTDSDGIFDGTERGLTEPETEGTDLSAGFFIADSDPSTTTDPTDADSDDDGILDGNEDKNCDGRIEPSLGETDPGNADSDGDGIFDGTEIGLIEPQNPDATNMEAGFFVPDVDPTTTTNPTNCDSDGDGVNDGDEDINGDGAYNPGQGETDPTSVGVVPGDLDNDGDIDMDDCIVFRSSLGKCTGDTGFIADADYDGDGCVTYADYRIWYGYYRNL